MNIYFKDAVRTLIKNGADVNKPLSASKHRTTPLMIAAQRGDLNIARLLVQNGANVEMLGKLFILKKIQSLTLFLQDLTLNLKKKYSD